MIKIFIEAKKDSTPEYNFISTFLKALKIDSQYHSIVTLGGKDNLHNARNQFLQNTLEGGTNLIIFDADSEKNGGGYEKRKRELVLQLKHLEIEAKIFLWPNNSADGDFESMLEGIARKDLHGKFFGCFNDYELCLGKDYFRPNLKGKLYAYISSMKLNNKQRNKVGSGCWMFDNPDFWDIESSELNPLREFLISEFSN